MQFSFQRGLARRRVGGRPALGVGGGALSLGPRFIDLGPGDLGLDIRLVAQTSAMSPLIRSCRASTAERIRGTNTNAIIK